MSRPPKAFLAALLALILAAAGVLIVSLVDMPGEVVPAGADAIVPPQLIEELTASPVTEYPASPERVSSEIVSTEHVGLRVILGHVINVKGEAIEDATVEAGLIEGIDAGTTTAVLASTTTRELGEYRLEVDNQHGVVQISSTAPFHGRFQEALNTSSDREVQEFDIILPFSNRHLVTGRIEDLDENPLSREMLEAFLGPNAVSSSAPPHFVPSPYWAGVWALRDGVLSTEHAQAAIVDIDESTFAVDLDPEWRGELVFLGQGQVIAGIPWAETNGRPVIRVDVKRWAARMGELRVEVLGAASGGAIGSVSLRGARFLAEHDAYFIASNPLENGASVFDRLLEGAYEGRVQLPGYPECPFRVEVRGERLAMVHVEVSSPISFELRLAYPDSVNTSNGVEYPVAYRTMEGLSIPCESVVSVDGPTLNVRISGVPSGPCYIVMARNAFLIDARDGEVFNGMLQSKVPVEFVIEGKLPVTVGKTFPVSPRLLVDHRIPIVDGWTLYLNVDVDGVARGHLMAAPGSYDLELALGRNQIVVVPVIAGTGLKVRVVL